VPPGWEDLRQQDSFLFECRGREVPELLIFVGYRQCSRLPPLPRSSVVSVRRSGNISLRAYSQFFVVSFYLLDPYAGGLKCRCSPSPFRRSFGGAQGCLAFSRGAPIATSFHSSLSFQSSEARFSLPFPPFLRGRYILLSDACSFYLYSGQEAVPFSPPSYRSHCLVLDREHPIFLRLPLRLSFPFSAGSHGQRAPSSSLLEREIFSPHLPPRLWRYGTPSLFQPPPDG